MHCGRQEMTIEEGLSRQSQSLFSGKRLYIRTYFLPSVNCQIIVKTMHLYFSATFVCMIHSTFRIIVGQYY